MPLHVTPQSGIPLPDDFSSEEPKAFSSRAKVAVKTAEVLVEAGAEIKVAETNKDTAVDMFKMLTDAENQPTPTQAATTQALTDPATVAHLMVMMRDYDHQVVEDAVQLRRFITNKLIEETTKENATNRIKALELLGKISDVGLFTEKTEITVKDASMDDLQTQIRSKLLKILGKSKVIDASYEVIEKEMGTLTPEDLAPRR
jgi:hypothetical protein